MMHLWRDDHAKAGKKPKMRRNRATGRFVVNGAYVKRQASEAVSLFFAPISGVVSAVTGEPVEIGKNESGKKA